MISSQGSLWLKSHPPSPSLPSLYSTLHFEIKNNRLLNKMVHFTIDKNYTPCNILILWFFTFSPIKWQFLSTYLILTKIKIKKKKKKNIKARWLISSMYSFFFFLKAGKAQPPALRSGVPHACSRCPSPFWLSRPCTLIMCSWTSDLFLQGSLLIYTVESTGITKKAHEPLNLSKNMGKRKDYVNLQSVRG